jgi:hypothetical protein
LIIVIFEYHRLKVSFVCLKPKYQRDAGFSSRAVEWVIFIVGLCQPPAITCLAAVIRFANFGRLRVFDSRLGKTVVFSEYVLESWGWQVSGVPAQAGHNHQTGTAVPLAVNMLAYAYRSLP